MCHSCLEALLGGRIATADARDDSDRTDVLSRITPRFRRMALDQQETTPAIAVRQWNKKATSISGQRVEPTHGDVTDPSIDDDRICWLTRPEHEAVADKDGRLRPGSEIVPRSPR